MLTFFRRLRKGLLDGGRISKYLLYALGEIALVVIGILIALQVNNWNQIRIEQVQQKQVLNDVHSEFQTNKEKLNQARNFLVQTMSTSFELIKLIGQSEQELKSRNIDSLLFLPMEVYLFSLPTMPYQILSSLAD